MKIAVAGAGYVGLSLAVLFAQEHEVIICEPLKDKVDLINSKISPIKDDLLQQYLVEKELDLKATTIPSDAYSEADVVFIAGPTNYDEKTNYFDTSIIEQILDDITNYNNDVNYSVDVGHASRVIINLLRSTVTSIITDNTTSTPIQIKIEVYPPAP